MTNNAHGIGCMCPQCSPNEITDDMVTGGGKALTTWDRAGLISFHRQRVAPFYDRRADYNTDAVSYYDYLGIQSSEFLDVIVPMINRLLRRDLAVKDSITIDATKTGSWIGERCDCGATDGNHSPQCSCYHYQDTVSLSNEVKLSPYEQNFSHNGVTGKLSNGISKHGSSPDDVDAGIWSADWTGVINSIIDKVVAADKKHTTIKKGSGINLSQDTNANGGLEYTISSPIGDMPSGDYNLSAKEKMWADDGATSGDAIKDFSNGSYSVRWTVNGNLGFATDISIVTATSNKNITWQTIDEAGGVTTYNCAISVSGKHWTATSTFVKVGSDGSVTTGTTPGFSVQEISRLVDVKMHFG